MKIAITNLRVSSTKYIVHCTLNILHAFFPDGPVISGEAIAITIGHSMLIRPVLISKKNSHICNHNLNQKLKPTKKS